ncbi:MAG: excinuclease ABC subunit UvrA, partial [Phycisphaerae bacterium]|nr:excinuclease ABC subunit UvrA [Phycisphaerae bacterium]
PPPGRHAAIDGTEHLDKVVNIDQSPIGRTPRSNPATYIKLFDQIRTLYSTLPDSKVRGYRPGRFSFNVQARAGGGRCEACEGNGANKMEMDFLADVWVTCPICGGHRFSRETLQILFKGKSIADVLEMDVQQALTHFENIPKVASMLQTLHDVGMDYIKLGQSSTTLSGGEAQRVKLARELVKRSTGRTLYLLDEPTTGLHFDDINKLLAVLHGFVDAGNTVVVIEHNLDVIKTADWVIDLGPEGGEGGGEIVAAGTPEQVAAVAASYTGQALRPVLSPRSHPSRKPKRAARRAGNDRREGPDVIQVVGACQHNLKDITVEFPRGRTTVCTGVSGSGKSSFALDTVYAEGQRRYVESLSAYARQFLGQLAKPRVERVEGLSPAISIEQKSTSKSPRSSVGTVTEIYDYLRILWARLGQPYCPKCNVPIGTQTSDEIVARILDWPSDSRLLLCAPIERTGAETYAQLFQRERNNGYARVRVDGGLYELTEPLAIDSRRRHDVQVVVDRVRVRPAARSRIADSVEQALALGNGWLVVVEAADGEVPVEKRFSQRRACTQCGTSYEDLSAHHFSFNNPLGWCPTCEGLGTQQGTSVDAIVAAPSRGLLDGAITGWEQAAANPALASLIEAIAAHVGFDPATPWSRLSASAQRAMLFGFGEAWLAAEAVGPGVRVQWKGFFPAIDEASRSSWQYRNQLSHLMGDMPCRTCHGARLRADAAAVRFADRTLADVCALPMGETHDFFAGLTPARREKQIAGEVLHEVISRLRFLVDVGLDYITLDRGAPTLSGGESQRIRLASQLGSGLTGVLYVLDEPTIGLHPRDTGRLVKALRGLRDLGNTLLMVEHDREVIEHADHLLDFGPGAGRDGGRVVADGSPGDVRNAAVSLTGKYLARSEAIAVPTNRRRANGRRLSVIGAHHNNLKNIDVDLPLGLFTVVTGVSGSGKSSLVNDVLYAALARRIHHAKRTPGGHQEIRGVEHIDKVIDVDQTPIGLTPASNPATYTGLFDTIRELFSKLPDSKVRGYQANRFSFNRPGGRCEACEGNGQKCIEMHFLPDVWIPCEECGGTRYNRETLDVRYRGRNISDVLNMRVSEALEHFANVPKVRRMLQTLADVGLDYVQLGQPAHTLSGGEAQRVKLAAEIGRPSTGQTLYVLDEPTTGLHFDDLKKLLTVLHRLVDLGNTVLCIEHNLDVIKTADWVVDLGPEAGDAGGEIVAEGPPEKVAKTKASHTGRLLAAVLAAGPLADRPIHDAKAEAEKVSVLESALKLADLGDEAAVPWERDGRAWHTRDRVGRRGEKIRWEGAALLWLVDEIHKAGRRGFAETDWANRSTVEIRSPNKHVPWFFHGLTGGAWLLDVTLRVPPGTFRTSELVNTLKLKKLDEREDLPIYGQKQRVRIHRPNRQWDLVRMQIHDKKELATPGAREIIRTAVRMYLTAAKKAAVSQETLQPWKTNGRAWHLSQKSIPPHHPKMWQPATLVELLGRIGKLVPGMTVDWNRKVSLELQGPPASLFRARVGTSHAYGIKFDISCPAGSMTPTRVDRLGMGVRITRRAKGTDVVSFWVQRANQVDPAQLAALVRAWQHGHGPAQRSAEGEEA